MNFLAHLYLSGWDEQLMVGNFIADQINNRQLILYAPGVQRGVILHRKIDQFTDAHPSVLRGVRRMYDRHRKYAPVIIDVFYDYLLANHWEKYSEVSLNAFTQEVYDILMAHHELMPPGLKKNLPHMIRDDWLTKYAEIYGMQRAFGSMRRRASKPEWLDGVIDTLKGQLPELREEFNAFFPDIIAYVNEEKEKLGV